MNLSTVIGECLALIVLPGVAGNLGFGIVVVSDLSTNCDFDESVLIDDDNLGLGLGGLFPRAVDVVLEGDITRSVSQSARIM